jgi:hypothetical protein
MSITGKNTKVIRKKEVAESKSLSQGFEKLTFATVLSAGATGIDINALIPPAGWTTSGRVNPSPSRIAEARMFQFKDNIEIISSLRGVLMKESFSVVSNSQINFVGFTAEEGEAYEVAIDANPINSIQVIAAKQPVAQGDLAIGVTDFPLGFSTKTTADEIVVFRNGLEQKRNTNNSDTVLDGNYYVVDAGSGFGNVVRFNTAPVGQDDYIKVTAIGGIVESPTNNTWNEIEVLQGQINAMAPDLALATGNPVTDYQSAPNAVDAAQFGSRVIDAENDIIDLQNDRFPIACARGTSVADPAANQPFILSVAAANPDGMYNPSTGIFTTTEPGYYEISGQIHIATTSPAGQFYNVGLWIGGVLTDAQTTRATGSVDSRLQFDSYITYIDAGVQVYLGKLNTNYINLAPSGNLSSISFKLVRRP